MAKERNALKAGIFIACSIGLALAIIVGITGTDSLLEPRQIRKVIFPLDVNIGGLRAGDPVRIGGLTVGTVHAIELIDAGTKNEGGQSVTEVSIMIPKKYVLRKNAEIQIESTLTGAAFLNFRTMGKGEPLAQTDTLDGAPGGMTAMFNDVTKLMPLIKEVIATVNKTTLPTLNNDLTKLGNTEDSFTSVATSSNDLVVHLRGNIDPVIGHFNSLTDNASKTLVQVKDLAQHVDNGIVPNVSAVTGTLKDKLPGILDKVSALLTQGGKSLQTAQEALEFVKPAFANAEKMTGTAKDVVVGNKSKLNDMIASLKAAADNLKNGSSEIRRSPWRLIYKPGPDELANLNIYDSARQFAEGANALKDAAQALRDGAQNKDLPPDQLRHLMDDMDKRLSNFNVVERKLWREVKE